MVHTPPPDWKTLNVVRDLGITRTDGNLVIHRTQKGSNQVYARWLPELEDDPRPRKYDDNGKPKKRIPYEKAMKTADPIEGAQRAVDWLKALKKDLYAQMEQKDYAQEHSLERYWKEWWEGVDGLGAEKTRLQNKKTGSSRIRDREQQWMSPEWGIGSQEWAKKRIDLINYQDLQSYWEVLDRRATPTNDMVGTKQQQRSLLNKIFKQAMQTDMPGLRPPIYPEIKQTISKPPVQHLTKPQWEKLLKGVVDLSDGAANKQLTQQEYRDLEFNPQNRKNQRNWVDLHDTLLLLWFFHLRATDPHVVKTEMFSPKEDSEGETKWHVNLDSDKSQRDIVTTTHYRDGALPYMDRVKARKPRGHLCFPFMRRQEGAPKNSKVIEKANTLLKDVLQEVGIDPRGIRLTEIRHTAFRLTLEERPELGRVPDIDPFARNGHTSPEMLRRHYLRYMDIETSARTHRITQTSQYELVKRVSMEMES